MSNKGVVEAYVNDPMVEKQISTRLISQIYAGVHFSNSVLIVHGADEGLVSAKASIFPFEII
jgi:lysophospholipase